MSKLYLQELVATINYEELPLEWRSFKIDDFSQDKHLFEFQQQALKAILKTLYKYYTGDDANKNKMQEWYKTVDKQINNLDITAKDATFNLYHQHNYKITKKQIRKSKIQLETVDTVSFAQFSNRLCLWMATGSGKTLVIVKLIQLLNYLMKEQLIPNCPILFLAHQEKLISQLNDHVAQYNKLHHDQYIELVNLRSHADDLSSDLFAHDKIRVYTYRSDLIRDSQKDNQINYANYLNNGQWYIILDEAHKGNVESTRQTYYNIMSQAGFLFNFSATFTEAIDLVTTCYEYNLSSFIKNGHGKNLYLSQKAVDEFKRQGELVKIDQKKIVLRALIVLTYIKKVALPLQDSSLIYHNPMLVSFVNSVNKKEKEEVVDSKSKADLVMLFSQIANFATGKYPIDLLAVVIDELVDEYQTNKQYLFSNEQLNINFELLKAISYSDILAYVFNSDNFATSIEVKATSSNNKELVFKLPTSQLPFALIKIGDSTQWLKDNLANNNLYQINNKTFDNSSAFDKLNDKDSSINMLLGSRAFYEGWDSNRPNVIMYINIGKREAKKFVLQSVGRGIRLEPIKSKRKRIAHLLVGETDLFSQYNRIIENNPQAISAIETLFVMGTSKEALDILFNEIMTQQNDFEWVNDFEINPITKDMLLLIPKYKLGKKYFDLLPSDNKKTYTIHEESLELLKRYCELMSDIVLVAKLGLNMADIIKLRRCINNLSAFSISKKAVVINNPQLIIYDVIKFYNTRLSNYSHLANLSNEIVHFKKIALSDKNKQIKLASVITQVKQSSNRLQRLEEIKTKYANNVDMLIEKTMQISEDSPSKTSLDALVIKNIREHYYIPLIYSEDENINYIKHIIKTPSEVEFIKSLDDAMITKLNNQCDWWMFSRIDPIDDIYIPYIGQNDKINKFYPDFIFWFKQAERYLIYFIDPKGDSYTDYEYKIDGFNNIFAKKQFEYESLPHQYKVSVHCKLITNKGNISKLAEGYRKHWISSLADLDLSL